MPNPMYDRYAGPTQQGGFRLPGPLRNIADIAGRFQKFAGGLQGNNMQEKNSFAEQQVRQMIANGQMTQEQFNQLSAFTQQLQSNSSFMDMLRSMSWH